MTMKTILIADDEQPVREIFVRALEDEDFRILEASNGMEAVAIAKKIPLDLALIDIKMPEMDGLEALKAIKSIDGTTEAIILTGYADMESLHQMMLKNGAYDYLLKPVKIDEWKHCVQMALEKRELALKEGLAKEDLKTRIQLLEQEYRNQAFELRQSQIKYKTIVEYSNDGILVVQDGYVRFANSKALSVTGYSWEEYIGKRILELIHPEDLPTMVKRNDLRKRGMDIPPVYTIRPLKKDGSHLWAEISAVETLWGGRPATLNFVRDVTEREEQLKSLKIRDAALTASINGIAFLDLDRRLTYVNGAFLAMWGYDKEDTVLGHRMEALWKDPQAVTEAVHILEERGAWVGEMTAVKGDGTLFDVQISATMVKDEAGRPITMMASFLDVTRQKQMMEEVRQSDKLSSLGQLAAGLAHELRNPLAVVSSCSQFCLDNMSLDRLVKENFQVIHRNAKRASELINDLLAFARPAHFEWRSIDLNKVIKKMLRMARLETRSLGIEYKLRFEKGLPPITGDGDKLGQVFLNLIQNAMQAVSGNGRITIRTQSLVSQKQVEASIMDDGPGIPDEYRSNIFDPFFTTKENGTGLGLSICHTMVTQHGGSITAEKGEGTGVKMCVKLPFMSEKKEEKDGRTHPAGGR